MKALKLLTPLLLLLLIISCSSVRVATDYDTKADFNNYKTFAFYKTGIDKATISDLDKKRIMRAIESELIAQGMQKSENPDVLVSIFTKSRERVDVNNNLNWGINYGWSPWAWGTGINLNINQYTEGTLFIDIIDTHKKELLWQGIGSGALANRNPKQKEERINEFVKEILSKYPPEASK